MARQAHVAQGTILQASNFESSRSSDSRSSVGPFARLGETDSPSLA